MCHGAAKSGRRTPKLFRVLADVATDRVADCKPQELAMTAWAFATARHASRELFDTLALEATPMAAMFKPQERSNLAWAFATLGHQAPELFE